MKKILLSSIAIIASLCFASCSSSSSSAVNQHAKFKARSDYRTTMEVYKNESAYAAATPENTSLLVSISTQRAQLLVGPENTVALDTPVCTGRAGKRTPTGRFPITEKIKYHGPRDKYVGASLPYWMRLTGDGIGMHGSSSVKRTPSSGGCIRTPHDVIPQIYAKVKKGTVINVVQ